MLLRDRIKEFKRVASSEIRPNVKNWRVHGEDQRNVLRGILAEVGIADANLVRELPDGTYELIDGHLRTAEYGPDNPVPVLVLDVTEEEADKLLATLDPLAAMAAADEAKLAELLDGLKFESESVGRMLIDVFDSAVPATGGVDGSGSETGSEFPEFPAADDPGEFVAFKFGDYGGRISKSVYESFCEEYRRRQSATGDVMIDDVLRGWLGV
jgi:hypothetical protein